MSSSIIRPEDFSSSLKDVNRHRWTEGKLRHVIEACRGLRVSYEVQDGLMHDNAELIRLASSYSCQYGYLVRAHFEDGTHQDTVHRMDSLGAIVTLGHTGVQYQALKTYMDECATAVRIARDRFELRELGGGALRATPHRADVTVELWSQHQGTVEAPYHERYVGHERISLQAITETQVVLAEAVPA